jgi:replicative DNA helicase
MKKKSGIKGIFIDMIQLIKPEKHDQNKPKTEQLTNISKALKGLAKKEDIWICNVAAMNRDADKQNRKPKVSDIRETGQIESDSDLVLMLFRPNFDPESPPNDDAPEDVDLIIGKNRDGSQGTIQLTAEFQYSKFYPAHRESYQPIPAYKKRNEEAPF